MTEWRAGPWGSCRSVGLMGCGFVLLKLYLLRCTQLISDSSEGFSTLHSLLTNILTLPFIKSLLLQFFPQYFVPVLATPNKTKPLQEWHLGVHDRGLGDEHCSLKTSSHTLPSSPNLSPWLSLSLALLEKAAAAFSDVTDSNDSSQFCVLTVKRSLGTGDRQGGK